VIQHRRARGGAFRLTAITGVLLVAAPVVLAAGTAHASPVNWDAIAQCESGGNWSSISPNGHFGGLQFSPTTWMENGGVGLPSMASREEQIRVAENVLATQGLNAWPKCGSWGGSEFVPGARAASGCPVRAGSILGVLDLRQLCSLIGPLAALATQR
jgi:hypothetical protein